MPSSSAVRSAPTMGARIRPGSADRAVPIDLQASAPVARRRPAPHRRSATRVGPAQNRQRTGSRQPWQTKATRYPAGAPGPAPGPCGRAARMTSKTSCGNRARRPPGREPGRSRSRSPPSPAARHGGRPGVPRPARAANRGRARPAARRYGRSSRTRRRPWPPRPGWPAHRGYGGMARCSASRSSPSSHNATSPRSGTGANAAARLPITTGPHPAEPPGRLDNGPPGPLRRPGRRKPPRPRVRRQAASQPSEVPASGTTITAPRPLSAQARAASASPAPSPRLGHAGRHLPHRPRSAAATHRLAGRPAPIG